MKRNREWRVKVSDLRDITNFNMKVLLDKMPEGIITEEQRIRMIKHARRYGADYLIYAKEIEGIHYFHYGKWKDLRPRFSGFPVFYYFDKKGKYTRGRFIHFPVGPDITDLLSTGQY